LSPEPVDEVRDIISVLEAIDEIVCKCNKSLKVESILYPRIEAEACLCTIKVAGEEREVMVPKVWITTPADRSRGWHPSR